MPPRKVKLSTVGPLVTYKKATINLDGNIWLGRPGDTVHIVTSHDYQERRHLTLKGYGFYLTITSPTHAERTFDALRIYGEGPITLTDDFSGITAIATGGEIPTTVTGHEYAEFEDLSPLIIWPFSAFSPMHLRKWVGKHRYGPHYPFRNR
ncbi:Uncharacterised protein [Cutibacterium granulosum]|jgi:hypothetical protein|uniref:Uncharacterized protein n=1 Tax=Cutibacterium granulosum TaxID=33011 RepID=A0A239W6Z3_9ACTN|nr:Uncharacterised protein [Cutibacterium granulosum]